MFGLFKNKDLELYSPLKGCLIDITEVKDEVFSGKILGDGVAVMPYEGIVYSPFDGKVIQLFHTLHALTVEKDGVQILIHIGLDTVELKGEGFKSFVKEGEEVKKGQKLIEFDIDFIKSRGKDTVSPVIVANMDEIKSIEKTSSKEVSLQDVIFRVKK